MYVVSPLARLIQLAADKSVEDGLSWGRWGGAGLSGEMCGVCVCVGGGGGEERLVNIINLSSAKVLRKRAKCQFMQTVWTLSIQTDRLEQIVQNRCHRKRRLISVYAVCSLIQQFLYKPIGRKKHV